MGKTKSLTEGTPWKLILTFAVPILIGQIFQLLYSIIDTKVVGAVLGELALASVGSVSTLYNVLVAFAGGLTMGFSIIIAMHFGARNYEKLKCAYANTIVLSLVTVAIVVVVVIAFLTPILHLINVPEDEMQMSASYIRILVVGMVVTVLYNMCANSLRAIGDAVTPLIFLILASVLNVGLDYLFVLGFGWDVAGAAYATVLAQLVSVVLCFIRIRRQFPLLHVGRQDFALDGGLIGELYKSGLSMALMSCLVGFSSVVLQSAINLLGTEIIVAHTAARKVCEIMMQPSMVIGSAMATFSGQNFGAKLYDRIRTGIKSCLIMGVIVCVAVAVVNYTLSPYLIRFLTSSDNPTIIQWGSTYLKFEMSFLMICFVIVILRNTMQGFGERILPVISSIIEVVVKVIFALLIVPVMGYWGVIITEPVVWAVMVIPLIIGTLRFMKKYLARS